MGGAHDSPPQCTEVQFPALAARDRHEGANPEMVMTTMRKTLLAVAAFGLIGLGACSTEPVAPNDQSLFLNDDVTELVPDYAISSVAVVDGAGIGAARLPDSLQLTAEQKAAIAALHDAFAKDHADEIAQLRAIEQQIKQLRRSGGSREEVHALVDQARPILQGLADDFAALQDDIWAIYTDAQRAWIESHKPKVCDRRGPPRLTDEQIAKIRALKQAFQEAMADEIAAIQDAHKKAREAKQAGASAEEIRAILASVKDEMEALRAAEKRLEQAILDVLTPEQRARWCIVRQHVAPNDGVKRP
jgi:Spy/CpxP family protein refolding chaperone